MVFCPYTSKYSVVCYCIDADISSTVSIEATVVDSTDDQSNKNKEDTGSHYNYDCDRINSSCFKSMVAYS